MNINVSVIIVTHNRSGLLRRAIESVFSQTYKDFEVIIVDDGSTDNTREVAMSYGDRITYLYQAKSGLPAGRNSGIRKAAGRWIALLDDDDEWDKDKLSLQTEKIKDLPEPAFVCSNVLRDGMPVIDPKIQSGFIESIYEFRLPNPSWLISSKVFEKIGGFDESYAVGEDIAFLIRVYLSGIKVYYLKEVLAIINSTPNSMANSALKRLLCQERLLNEFTEYFKRDREHYFRYLYSLGKDAFRLGDKRKARKYFMKALFIKPWKLELLAKCCRL